MILFLGSGVSLASGLPGVPRIMTELRSAREEPRIQGLLDLLQSIDRHYLKFSAPYEARHGVYEYTGQIYRSDTTYEDLFYMASQIMLNGSGLINDATADAFSELVLKKGAHFLRGRTKIERAIDLTKLASQATSFIERKVADLLYCNTVRDLDLVVDLSKSDIVDRLHVITLNHDTLVEQLLLNHGIRYADGFGPRNGDLRWFEDAFPDDAKIWLIKLHGSINWYRSGDLKMAQPVLLRENSSATYPNLHSIPSFLSGQSKVASYHRGIFSDMQYRFQQALRRSRLIIMSGYGWGDTPLNFHLEYWLDRNVSNKMILLYENAHELVNRSKEMEQMYGAYTRSGRIVPIAKWLADTSIDDLEAHIASCYGIPGGLAGACI